MVPPYFFYTLAMMVASQRGRHHCECNDPEIFQTTLSARQPCSCLSHYERVIDQADSQIHSETECRCSQTCKVKQQKERMFCLLQGGFQQLWLYCPWDFQSQLSKLSRLTTFSIIHSYSQLSTEPELHRGNKPCIYCMCSKRYMLAYMQMVDSLWACVTVVLIIFVLLTSNRNEMRCKL